MNKKILSFKDLEVWQRAVVLAKDIYEATGYFPKEEMFGLTNQIRRAAVSISSNIAEGFGRHNSAEKINFYNIAHGSAAELESQLEISFTLGFLDKGAHNKLTREVAEISKMISGLKKGLSALRSKLSAGFTLVELLVAIALFAIAVSIAIGGFVRAIRTQRQLVALIAANSNASLAIEQMAREIRVGSGFSCAPAGFAACTELSFTSAEGDEVTYRQSAEGAIERVTASGPRQFTAGNVKVNRMEFFLQFADGAQYPPRITIALAVGANAPDLAGHLTNLATTISTRRGF